MRFSQSRYSVNESDGRVYVTLYHSNPSSIDVVMKVNSGHVSTNSKCKFLLVLIIFIIVDNDYNAGLYTVTIGAGVYGVTFSISITDDDIYEDSEMFSLTIDGSSLPNDITSGVPITTTVTILDNDSK